MKVRLQVQLSAKSSFVWVHTGPSARIGRNPGCELSLSGEGSHTVSWEHALLEPGPEGVGVRDLRSSNGTYVNGRVIKEKTLLKHGDQVGLGQTGPRLQVMEIQLSDGSAVVAGANATLAAAGSPPPLAVAVKPPVPSRASVAAGPGLAPPPLPGAAAFPVAKVAVPQGPVVSPARPARPPAPYPASSTRLLLVAMQKRHRRMWLIIGVSTVALLTAVGIVFAILLSRIEETRVAKENARLDAEKVNKAAAEKQAKEKHDEKARLATEKAKKEVEAKRNQKPPIFAGEEVYQRTLRSTAYVAVRLTTGARGNGSGSLVDKKRRLVLTAFHVVDRAAEVGVMFPQYQDGEVISDRNYYNSRLASIVIPGKVIASNPLVDLALIQLDSLPKGLQELPLAKRSPSPGSHVHTVGNPATSAGLWAYTFGAVRQVAQKKYTFVEKKQTIDACVVETQNPINRGDSGGPVVNDRIELVAVNSGATPNIRDGTICIDIREVKKLLLSVPP